MKTACARSSPLLLLFACGGVPEARLATSRPAQEPSATTEFELLAPRSNKASLQAGVVITKSSPSVDGRLSDWPTTPTLTFSSRTGETTDVWLAVEAHRIVLAARGSTERLALLLESHPPWFPPIGFAHQFGEETLASADECPINEPDEACVRWFNQSVARHDELRRGFSRALRLEGNTLTIDDEAVAVRPLRGDNGDLEVELPLQALPMTAEAPLRALRMSLRVDEDSPAEHALRVPLDEPLGFGPHPEWLNAVLNEAGPQLRFYQPSTSAVTVKVAFNQRVGYQYTPTELSPFVGELKLGPARTLATVGAKELVELPRSHDNFGPTLGFAWRVPSGELNLLPIEEVPPGPAVNAAFVRGDAVDLFFAYEETQNPFGAGLCGVCPMAIVSVVRAEADSLHPLARTAIVPQTGERVRLRTDPSGRFLEASFDCFERGQRAVRIDFEASTRSYVSSTDEVVTCHPDAP
jgi:hypothetical protein